MPGVSVGEQQDLTAGLAESLNAGPGLAEPPGRKLIAADQPDPGIV